MSTKVPGWNKRSIPGPNIGRYYSRNKRSISGPNIGRNELKRRPKGRWNGASTNISQRREIRK